jgi:hypothetical protein
MAAFQMSLAEAKQRYERARSTMAKVKEKTEEAIGQGIQVAEVAGSSFAFGWANAKFGGPAGEMQLFGIPLDLACGIGLTGVAMMGGFGKYGEHAVNMGAGAFASYATRAGYEMGSKGAGAGAQQALFSTAVPAGIRPAPQPRGMNGAAQQAQVAGDWDPHRQTYTVYDQGA